MSWKLFYIYSGGHLILSRNSSFNLCIKTKEKGEEGVRFGNNITWGRIHDTRRWNSLLIYQSIILRHCRLLLDPDAEKYNKIQTFPLPGLGRLTRKTLKVS